MRVPVPRFTMGRACFGDFGQDCVSHPAPQVGFPSVPTVSSNSCNFEILLPSHRDHRASALIAILSQGSQAMNVSRLTVSKFKPREMKRWDRQGQDKVGTETELA